MAIIYSYPRVNSLNSSDLFIATRFENEDNGNARSISLTAETIGQYVSANYINSYGLAALTTNATPVNNTTSALTLLNGTIAGTLTLPANSLVVGDSFKLSLAGLINSDISNNISISIKTLGGVVLAEFTGSSIGPSVSNSRWNLEATLTVRAIGAASTAAIATTAILSGGFSAPGTHFGSVNSTTFDTTVANTLVVTAQWGTASLTSFIYTQTFTLNKVY